MHCACPSSTVDFSSFSRCCCCCITYQHAAWETWPWGRTLLQCLTVSFPLLSHAAGSDLSTKIGTMISALVIDCMISISRKPDLRGRHPFPYDVTAFDARYISRYQTSDPTPFRVPQRSPLGCVITWRRWWADGSVIEAVHHSSIPAVAHTAYAIIPGPGCWGGKIMESPNVRPARYLSAGKPWLGWRRTYQGGKGKGQQHRQEHFPGRRGSADVSV